MEVVLLFAFLGWIGITLFCLFSTIRTRGALSAIEAELKSLKARLSTHEEGTQTPIPPSPAIAEATPPPAIVPAPVPVQRNMPQIQDMPIETATPVRPVKTRQERLDSLEQLVGTRWLNWAGTLVTLAGTAFLLKFIYEQGWIGPAGRVAIGITIGAFLLSLGEIRLRRLHPLLSQSISAAGCGALFLTTFLSYKFYDFGGRTATFGFLCWFALFTVLLAVVRHGPVLAFLGLLCAYLTPCLLSTGEDQAETLFAYLAILAAASTAVAVKRGWHGIVPLSFAFSLAYCAGWYFRFYSPNRLGIAVIGAAGLSLLFSAAALARSLWHRHSLRTEETVVAAAAYISGLWLLWDILNPKHEAALGFGLCALSLTAVAALKAVRQRRASSPAAESTLPGLAAGPLLLVIPAVLETEGAMIAWALAAVIFADIGIRARSLVLQYSTGFCLAAGLWVGVFRGVSHTGAFIPAANPVFIAWLAVILSWFLVGYRYSRDRTLPDAQRAFGTRLQVAASFMFALLLSIETWSYFRGRMGHAGGDPDALRDWRNIALCIVWACFPWLWLPAKRTAARLQALSAAHYLVFSLAYLVLLADLHHREAAVLLNPAFFAALLLPAGLYTLASRMGEERKWKLALELAAHLLCAILLAVELSQGTYPEAWSEASRDWVKMALISVAWALWASILLTIGISRNRQTWRWFALGLLGVTLLKVVFFDMAEVRQIWRVLSFMALGALLMVCSYAYSRRERRHRTGNPEPGKGGLA